MDLKQLESYIQVVDTGSFTKAAEKLSISQPTISTHIQNLENELSVKLLIRDSKSILVTSRGKELYDYAVKMLGLRDKLLSNWEDEDQGLIRMGASTIPSGYILPDLLGAYQKDHSVRFEIRQKDSEEILEGVKCGTYDLGIIGMKREDKEIVYQTLCQENMVLITPKSAAFDKMAASESPAPSKETIRRILEENPLLVRESGSGSGAQGDRIIQALGLHEEGLNICARLNDTEAMKRMVVKGLGVCIISELAIEDELTDGKICAFHLPVEESERSFYLIRRAKDALPAFEEEFVEWMCKKHD